MSDLVVVDEKNVVANLKQGKMKDFVESIREKAFDPVFDMNTAKGRDGLKSHAFKITKMKTSIEEFGKDLVKDAKAEIKKVDEERKIVRDGLDALAKEVRQPLTDYETAEKEREELLKSKLIEIENFEETEDFNSSQIQDNIDELEAVNVTSEEYGKYYAPALKMKESALKSLRADFIIAKNSEEEEAKAEAERQEQEAERQRLAEAKRLQELEDAKEQARIEAEEKAKREAEEEKKRVEAEKLQAQQQIEEAKRREQELKDQAIRDKALAKEREEQAEARRLQDIENAKQAEIKRQADEAREKQAEADRRNADVEHRRAINNHIKTELMERCNVTEEQAISIITVIHSGGISNIKLEY